MSAIISSIIARALVLLRLRHRQELGHLAQPPLPVHRRAHEGDVRHVGALFLVGELRIDVGEQFVEGRVLEFWKLLRVRFARPRGDAVDGFVNDVFALAGVPAGRARMQARNFIHGGGHHAVQVQHALEVLVAVQKLERRHLVLLEILREDPRHRVAGGGLIEIRHLFAQGRFFDSRNGEVLVVLDLLHLLEDLGLAGIGFGELGLLHDAHAGACLLQKEFLRFTARGFLAGQHLADGPPTFSIYLHFK
ncbi:MAG: hypothetical protein AB7H70_00630 [Rhodospirillaceae bacterium]